MPAAPQACLSALLAAYAAPGPAERCRFLKSLPQSGRTRHYHGGTTGPRPLLGLAGAAKRLGL